ncbi:MAG: AAA family ATPase [Clostridiales bacterium]|nr:AAA family ATPase [Clostridiales bacterium]
MRIDDKQVCLKAALLQDSVSPKALGAAILGCLDYAERLNMDADKLKEAFAIVRSKSNHLPCNDGGKRRFEGNDDVRNEICKLLYGVPLQNLRRREERILPADSAESAAPDVKPQLDTRKSLRSNVGHNPKESPVEPPLHIIETYITPDEDAFKELIGNSECIATLENQYNGAISLGESQRPLLLRGSSGCGKTEIARCFSRRRGKPFCRVTGAVLKSADDINNLLAVLENDSTILIDEVHAIGVKATAALLDILSNGYITADGIKNEFSFIFATNLANRLPDALKNRCLEIRVKDYTASELEEIVELTARKKNAHLCNGVARYIAERCNGIARTAVDSTIDLVVENAQSFNSGITLEMAVQFFKSRGVDEHGLKAEHRRYITILSSLDQASAHTMASALGENDTAEIEDAETLLLKHGFIGISSRGRYLTESGMEYAKRIEGGEYDR